MKNLRNKIKWWWREWGFPISGILTLIAVATIGIFVLFWSSNMETERQKEDCAFIAAEMDVNYKWANRVGCMIEVEPGKYVPLENYRYGGE